MKLNNILNFAKKTDLLVCETNGYSFRAAVLNRNGDNIEVHQTAQSELSDMTEAIKEVVSSLKADGWQGGRAILLSPAVLSTLVELPVDPKKPRSISQMQELIRWEVEPLLMQSNARWSVDNILVGHGYMTSEQAQTVIDMQQGNRPLNGQIDFAENLSSKSFGELAIEMGFIRKSQLSAALARLEWLKTDDEIMDASDIDCGWSEQGEVSDVPGMFSWLVSCVNSDILNHWVNTFKEQGINLQSMYPLTGCSGSLVNSTEASVIVESHKNMSFVTQMKEGKITFQHQYEDPNKTALDCSMESFHALSTKASETVFLASWQNDAQELVENLQQTLRNSVSLLSLSYDLSVVSLGMVGAFRHTEKPFNTPLCVDVHVGGPIPPLWQRPSTRAASLFTVLLVILLSSEMVLFAWKNQVLAQKAEVDAQWKVISDAKKRISSQISKIDERKGLLVAQQEDQHKMQSLLEFYSNDIPERVALVQSILSVLQKSVTDEVIINSIDELGKRASFKAVTPLLPQADKRIEVENFNLNAWAISEAAAQRFIQDIKQMLEHWDLEVRDPQVVSRNGPLNMSGFAVALRIVKLAPTSSVEKTKVASR